jgi:hypothetical protein
LGWGLSLLLLVSPICGRDKIFFCNSACFPGRDSLGFNSIDVGISCQKPLAALQFSVAPVIPGVQLLPELHFNFCQDWYYLVTNAPEGKIKIILLDSLLRGLPINPDGAIHAAWHIGCRVDSSAAIGIFPVRIDDVQACDTAGVPIPLEVQDGYLIITNKEALLFAHSDTFATNVGRYTWRLAEANLYPVGYLSFGLQPSSKGFNLKQVSISEPYLYWDYRWSQDSTGRINVTAWQTSPLISRPCLEEKDLMNIDLVFEIDSNLTPGVYQFEPIKMTVMDCSDNFSLSTEMALGPLVIMQPVGITPKVQTNLLSWRLGPVYPNPFNLKTTIQYTVAAAGVVEIGVFDLTGRAVQLLVKQFHQPGEYRCEWSSRDQRGSNVASGIYLVRMQLPNRVLWHKMLLIK